MAEIGGRGLLDIIIPDWLKTDIDPMPLPSYPITIEVVYIYGLVEPDTGKLRYIGKSIRPYERLQNHINDQSKCHRTNWIRGLINRGLKPELVLLESIQGAWPWQESEKWWIREAKRRGWNLVNGTSGGDGLCNPPTDVREKMRRTWIGRKHSELTKQKISKASKGRHHSEEHKQKMRALMTGRKITWDDKLSDAIRKFSNDQVLEIKKRLSAGEKVKNLAVEFKTHRTTISKIKKGTYYDRYRNNKSNS